MSVWFVVSAAAIVWIGGLTFISMVLVPTLRTPELRPQALVLLRASGRKFQRIAYASFVTLAVTGVANLYFKAGGSLEVVGAWLPTPYGRLLAAKVLLVLAIVALSLYHDFVVGPRAAPRARNRPGERRGASAQAPGVLARPHQHAVVARRHDARAAARARHSGVATEPKRPRRPRPFWPEVCKAAEGRMLCADTTGRPDTTGSAINLC